ncbi:MAG: hypothetical protein ACXAD7_17325 [Candidatus Kariarchaeaceae archaeon]|jgi:ABC-type transport system involved in multi-copper enzyme maturation permease subunit
MINETENNSHEYLQKFGYRGFQKELTSRKSRIFSLVIFEVKSTWSRSTFGKVLLVILCVINFMTITFGVAAAEAGDMDATDESIRDGLNRFVANYMNFGENSIQPGTVDVGFGLNMSIGILLFALFAIAGSGFFADDKSGKVIEIYLSRLQKKEYVTGKILAIMIYINFFVGLPILIMGALSVQSINQTSHLEQWDFYLGIILFSLLSSLILGMGILIFSILSDKRAYASLGFFMTFLIGSILGDEIWGSNESNEFFLLISPPTFLALLAYLCLGDLDLGLMVGWNNNGALIDSFILDDGAGLEWWHITGITLSLIILMASFLSYKIWKMTTEEL